MDTLTGAIANYLQKFGYTPAAAPTALVSGGADIILVAGDGVAPLIGLYGVTPTAQATITGTAPTDPIVVQLLAALVGVGLVADGTT